VARRERNWRSSATAVALVVAAVAAAALIAAAPPPPAGVPFGPWHLPAERLAAPFTGTQLGLHPEDAVPRLEAARRAGFRVFVRLALSRRRFSGPDGSFDLERWKREIDRFRGIDFAPYVSDGTLLGHFLFDEPHDPTNWNGRPVPFAVIESTAAYSKRLWPTLPTGVGSPPSFLAGGAPWGALDFAETQYRPQKGDLSGWIAREVAAARATRLGTLFSLNVLDGNGRGKPLTGAQLEQFGTVLAREPTACALLLWKYDPAYFSRDDVWAAVAAIATAAGHAAASCVMHR